MFTATIGRRAVLLSAGMLTLGATAGCGLGPAGDGESETTPGGEASGGTLRIALATPVQTLDLSRYKGQPDLIVGQMIFDSLVGMDADLAVVPRLAESWEQTDPTTYVFTLREGVTFHDGSALTGDLVKQMFDVLVTLEPLSSWTEPIDSVAASGSDVTFHLKHPSPSLLYNLANGPFSIQSPDSLSLDPADLAQTPVGTGAYKLQSWSGDVITLTRNEHYWGEPWGPDEVVLTSVTDANTRLNGLESGEFDAIQNVDPFMFTNLGDESEVVGLKVPYAQTVWLLFTHANPLLADIRVREAIALALDVPQIVESATEGLARPATGFVPPEIGGGGIPARARDLERARELLAEAGHPNGLSIPLFNTNGRYVGDNDISQIVQSQLAEVGITAEITVYEYAGLLDVFERPSTGLVVIGWTHRATPDAMLGATFDSSGGFNWSVFHDDEYDALLKEAANSATREEAEPLWVQADERLVAQFAGVPIYWATSLFGVRSEIGEFHVDPIGLIQVNDVTIN